MDGSDRLAGAVKVQATPPGFTFSFSSLRNAEAAMTNHQHP